MTFAAKMNKIARQNNGSQRKTQENRVNWNKCKEAIKNYKIL